MQSIPPAEEVLATWSAPVMPRHHRSVRWYVIATIIIALCVTYGVLRDSIPFAVVAVLTGIVYALLHRHAPPDRTFSITSAGVILENRSVSWAQLQGFWFFPTREYTELHFVFRKAHLQDLIIQTGTQDINMLRAILQTRLPELTDRKERLLDTFIRICKL